MHWIRLPDGGYLNLATLTSVGPPMPTMPNSPARYRAYSTQSGYNGSRLEGERAAAVVAAIEGLLDAGRPLFADDENPHSLAARVAADLDHGPEPGTDPAGDAAARHIREGEERALAALKGRLREAVRIGVVIDTEAAIGEFVAQARWALDGGEGASPLLDPQAIGQDGLPGLRQLDLRQGDDVLLLRYGGHDYVAALKLRFGDGAPGMPARYREICWLDPQTRMWAVLERMPWHPEDDSGLRGALRVVLGHDRAAASAG